tara:strand:+ start:5343 stop:5531 length:189 start_codon:yes stop_codon:yes gene_type:complete
MTSSAVKNPSSLSGLPYHPLLKEAKQLEGTNEGLSRRVKNLEEEVTILFAIAGLATAWALIF